MEHPKYANVCLNIVEKQSQIIEQFYDQAWSVIELIKKNGHNDGEYYHKLHTEVGKLYEILTHLPEKVDNASFADIREFFSPALLLHVKKKSIAAISYADLKKALHEYVLREPYAYHYYFRIGSASDYPEGYQLGNGKLYPFDKLPTPVRRYISRRWRYDYKENKEYARTLKEYSENRKKDWYMHVEVKSVGWNRANEKAVLMVRRNVNIYKLVYFTESYYEQISGQQSPFDYCFSIENGFTTGGAEAHRPFTVPFYRVQWLDTMISEINSIINKVNQTDLEKRILNTIDIFGMIDNSTPLHIRFILCIIALEGLLLAKGDKDYLGWKLAEKISFLLADSPAWNAVTYNIDPKNSSILTSEFIAKQLVKSRIRLEKQIHNLYDKRSYFAHRGLGKKKRRDKEITPSDYRIASLLVRWTVEKLLELRKNGIRHIAKEKDDDNVSLDEYIITLKYG